jgi:hypothetical protein
LMVDEPVVSKKIQAQKKPLRTKGFLLFDRCDY